VLTIALYVIIAALIAGFITGALLKRFHPYLRITQAEFVTGAIAICLILVPSTAWIGWKIAQASNLTFYENWNGWESSATRELIKTERDGPGRWTYDCDPYTVIVSYDCGDSKNPKTCYRTETRYHQCPYTTFELNYDVGTTLGDYTVDTHRLPDNPNQHRWRRSVPVPDYIQQRAGVGEPRSWRALRERLQQGQPAPVTTRNAYDNYILASNESLMRKHSADIAEYEAKGLMPKLSRGLSGFINPQRCFVFGNVPFSNGWAQSLAYTNGSLGQVQCDLYVVITNDKLIGGNPDRYMLALQAYMLDAGKHGKDALAKNALVVLIGTRDSGERVDYARAFTGMPRGNERLAIALNEQLAGKPFSHELLLGKPTSVAKSSQSNAPDDSLFSSIASRWSISVMSQAQREPGIIPRILMGKEVQGVRFKRVSMTGKDGQGGYLYLRNDIRLGRDQEWYIGIAAFITSCLIWVLFAMCDGDSFFNEVLRKLRSHIRE
jgi:hypothetical protein